MQTTSPAAEAAAAPAPRSAADADVRDTPRTEREGDDAAPPRTPGAATGPQPRAPRASNQRASRRARRTGLVHGDNTGEALRYAPLSPDFGASGPAEGAAAGHGSFGRGRFSWGGDGSAAGATSALHPEPATQAATATAAGAQAAAGASASAVPSPSSGAPPPLPAHDWHRWTRALPLNLLPLLGSLPAVANNLRHAQRNVAWWRSFHRLDVRLVQRAAHLDLLGPIAPNTPPELVEAKGPTATPNPAPTDAPAAWARPLASARTACARERAGVRMALNDARYSLAFNAVEFSTYLAGALPLALHAAGCGWAGLFATGASHAVPLLLLASGLLHVAQRISWLTCMVRTKRAAAASVTLPPTLQQALVQDAGEGVRFHAVQLGMWTMFCGAMLVTTGALTGAGLLPVAGGVWAVASMLGARVHRLVAARRLEVPEHAVWHRDASGEDAPGPLHAPAFDDAPGQAAALDCVQRQARAIDALRKELWHEHARRAWSALARLASALSGIPGAASLLGAACSRAFANRGADVARAVLRAQQTVWQAQRPLLTQRHAALTARLHALTTAPPPPPGLQTFAQERRDTLTHALEEVTAQQAQVTHALGHVAPLGMRPDAGAAEAWPALRNTWHLPAPRPKVGYGPQGVGELLLHAARGLEDTRCALLWGAGLGCVVSAH